MNEQSVSGVATSTTVSTIWPTARPQSPTPETAPPARCTVRPLANWVAHQVVAGEALASIAARTGASVVQLEETNCIRREAVVAGQTIYASPAALTPADTPTWTPTLTERNTPTITPIACVVSPPPGWNRYTVQRGDTLSELAVRTGTTTAKIMVVNCFSNAAIAVGQSIFLPAAIPPADTPTPTHTPTLAPADTSTPTPTTGAPPSATPTSTLAPADTLTPTGTASPTGTPTPTNLPEPILPTLAGSASPTPTRPAAVNAGAPSDLPMPTPASAATTPIPTPTIAPAPTATATVPRSRP